MRDAFGQSDHGCVTWLARIGFRTYHHAMVNDAGSLLALVFFSHVAVYQVDHN